MYRRSSPRFSLWQLIILGALAGVLYLLYTSWQQAPPEQSITTTDSGLSQATTVTQMSSPVATQAATAEPVTDDIMNAHLIIPSAAINQSVIRAYLDGTSWNVSELGMNVGHLQGTAWLGDGPGNIVLSGHVEMRDGRAGVFANLSELTLGDAIMLQQNGVELWYQVTDIYNVKPDDLTPVYPSTTPRLTLITCDAYNFLSNAYEERVVVIAEPLES